ncbi:MAG TPA: chemotaxis protein CheW [Rhodanobacter sp.]|nr:chemotaxis protein CheW [Rhodanobacter sp.]
MSTATSTSNPSTREPYWLSMKIGHQIYAVPLSEVNEVIRDEELTPVPGAATDLLGIRHLRGRIMPVLDGRRRLGLTDMSPQNPEQVRVITLSCAGQLIGFRVDEVGELLNIHDAEVAAPQAGRATRSDDPVSGVLSWQNDFVALLDPARLCRMQTEVAHVA